MGGIEQLTTRVGVIEHKFANLVVSNNEMKNEIKELRLLMESLLGIEAKRIGGATADVCHKSVCLESSGKPCSESSVTKQEETTIPEAK
ncbi:hypothetical protein M5689_007046 [Euphorbia peplus]|nr:hypothetical protein M5689_007046 [Euphorbia peplus]